MNFDYNEEQQLLADSVRRYLAKSYDFESRKKIVAGLGWSKEAWAQFAEMGLMGLPVSTEHGGFGGGAVDLMGVMEAFGEALVVEPYLPLVLAVRLHELPGVVEGKTKLALAHNEKGARFSIDAVKTRASKKGAGWVLDGEKAAVIGAPIADHLVVSARDDSGIALFLVDIGKVSLQAYRTMDERLAADVMLRGAEAQRIEGGRKELEEVIDVGTALVCAEAVGAMKFTCDTTLEYLKTRKQFGVTIGTFQALQHRMVEMFISLEQARSMACLACSKADAGGDPRAISAAKIKVADAARHVSQEAVQLHGGMGMTEELKISHAFRRLTVLAREFGDADHHLARFSTISAAQ
ncbi:MAG TPA: acyl-CoA dehydrogenase [Burkholderiales bacterium]|jgi:alkylation response protein AidB-like acyl-CoA dehydrogenase|nr:acyl-CoA dehydrogenase [Burkholderiales bacterium]